MTWRQTLNGLLAVAVIILVAYAARTAQGGTVWHRNEASWYAPTGNPTSCGRPMNDRSWHVAALHRREYRCGRRVRLCRRGRCVNVRVQDRGAWRGDDRAWDLTPRVKRALRCPSTCNVNWRGGWA